ncbi:MAG: PD40 domain-containing protein [Gemmatimonadaceae bacterium]|nr:PD40 domain-containing protein [Gemmatimonadaceae bacterium]
MPFATLRALGRTSALRATFAVLWLAGTAAAVDAQDRQPGVTLGLSVRAGQKTGVLVQPISGPMGDSLATMLSRDLDFSDQFTIIASSSVAAPIGPANYALYSKLGADGVVQGTLLPSGWLRIALHDVAKKAVVNQKDFPLPAPAGSPTWRMAVHGISDGIVEWITGQRGIAQTRIAFTRDGRVWTIDSDGANVIPVTPSGMSAQWVPSGRALVYSVLDGGRNPLMFVDLTTGAQRVLASAPNSNDISPAISPDGRTVIFARVGENGTDMYAVPIEGGAPRRITSGRGRASLQPSFSPDGQRIVFMSDRSGPSDVYISDVDGTNAEVLNASTYGDRNNRTGPDWSPDGRLIAFQSLNGNSKQIMTINLRDQSMRSVASEGRNEDPSWAPDSRHLVFTSDRSGVRQLWVVDVESGRTRQLKTGSAARLAAWSPRQMSP